MHSTSVLHRRNFMGRMVGAAAAAGLSIAGTRAAGAQESGAHDWIKEVKGTHRCLFDFPQHKNGFPLLHILNYINTYSQAYKTTAGQVGAVGTFYAVGSQSSIPLAFNDDIWAKNASSAPIQDSRTRPARCTHKRVQPADAEGSSPVDAGRRFADDSGARRRHASDRHRASRRWARSSSSARTRWASGASSSRLGAKAKRRTSRKTCARTCFRASPSFRRW